MVVNTPATNPNTKSYVIDIIEYAVLALLTHAGYYEFSNTQLVPEFLDFITTQDTF